MYALLCIFVLITTWMIFLTRIFMNLRREDEIKRNNQKYYQKKIKEFKKDIHGKE